MQELQEWLEKLKNCGKVILVEGIKDKKALEELGVENIMTLKKPLFAVVEDLEDCKEVVVLTDLDKAGKELYGRLSKDLKRHGVKIDMYFREFLFKNTKLRQIEGIKRLF